jgi:hypothetical protein
MTKKLYAALLPLFAVAAFAVMPAVAQAAPHFYKCEAKAGGKYHDADCTEKVAGNFELTRLPFTSAKTQVITWGKLTLTNATLGKVTCKKIDAGNVWNTTEAAVGKDNIEVFVLYECTAAACPSPGVLTVTAAGLPWLTELVAGTPIRDKTTGISVTIKCTEPAVEAVFTGELTPEFVNDSPSYTEFGPGSGHLTSSVFGEGTITGKDKIMGFENQEQIQVFNP